MFYRDKETGKIRLGNPEKKPAPAPEPVIAGMKAEPLGLLQPEPEIPTGDATVRFLKGAVANQRCYSAGDEAVLPVEVALLLKADKKAEVLTLLPPREAEDHPYRRTAIAEITARMRGVAAGATAAVDWIRAPLGKRFNPFQW